MFYLLKKELTANIRYLLISVAIFILYIFIFSANKTGLFMMCLVFCFYALSTTNMVVDERYKIELLLSTLPIRRRDVVISKYMLILVIFVGSFVLYTLLVFIGRSLGYDKIPPLTPLGVAVGFLVISLFNGIMLPLAYKFGAQATRYVSFILFFGVFFLSSFLGKLDLSGISGFLQMLNELQLSLLAVLVAAVINLLSYPISLSLYKKKDF